MEEALRRSESRLNAIIHSVRDGLLVLDPTGRLQLINSADRELLSGHFHPEHGDNLEQFTDSGELRDYLRTLSRRPHNQRQQDITLADGRGGRILQLRSSFLRNDAGLCIGSVSLLRDGTWEREQNRMKIDFISTADHELCAPLTAIMGFSELLLNHAFTPDQQQDFLTEIHDNSANLSHLVDDLLDISRIESGGRFRRDGVPAACATSCGGSCDNKS